MAGNWRRRGGSIELRVYAGRDPLTNRKRYETKTIPLVGKREADREWALFAAEVAGGDPVSAGRRTLGDLLERWFDKCSPDWSPGTAYQTRWIIDRHRTSMTQVPGSSRRRLQKRFDVAALPRASSGTATRRRPPAHARPCVRGIWTSRARHDWAQPNVEERHGAANAGHPDVRSGREREARLGDDPLRGGRR